MTFSLRIQTIARSPGTASGCTGGSTTARDTGSHGAPFNGNYPNGVNTLIKKNSNVNPTTRSRRTGSDSRIVGVKGKEPIASDWSLIFNFQNGFDPYTLQRANGPKSLVQNNTTPLDRQTANGDSSRAGQLFNTEAYAGFSHPTYGALTAGRQNSLILDGLSDYDAMSAAPAFSVIGVSSTVAGGGDTENARYNTSAKYDVSVGPLRFVGALSVWRLRSGQRLERRDLGRGRRPFRAPHVGSRGSEGQGRGFALELRPVSSSRRRAVERPQGDPLQPDERHGWRRDTSSARRRSTPAGNIFCSPIRATPMPNGFTAIGNYPVPAGFVNATAYDEHKILRVFWTGVKYAVRDNLDIAAAYYHYYQNDYNTSPCTDGGLSASSCRGALNAYSAMINYRPVKARRGVRRLHMVASHRRLGERLSLQRQLRADDRRPGGVLTLRDLRGAAART